MSAHYENKIKSHCSPWYNLVIALPRTPQNDGSLQHVDLLALHVLPHLLDGLDILLERCAGPDDVCLGRHVEPLQPVDLGGEGGGWGDHRVVQDVVLLRHNPGQALGHLGTSLDNAK